MNNVEINEVILSKQEIQERVDFLKEVYKSTNRLPNFKFVYTTNLLKCIEKCKEGYNDIKSIYDNSLEILEALDIKIDYYKTLDDMYVINEQELKELPNVRLLDSSIQGVLVKC